MSSDGRFLVAGYRNANGRDSVFIRDRRAHTTTILNDAADADRSISDRGGGPSISGDGACVVLKTGVTANTELRAFVTCASTSSSQLRLVHSADNATLRAGAALGFTLTITNSGGLAIGVDIRDPLPARRGIKWSIASHSGTPPCEIGGHDGAKNSAADRPTSAPARR
jgi:hypothetical protein